MRERWRFVDLRYFSITFAYESVTASEAVWSLSVWIRDILARPLCVIHIAVAWRAILRCENFVFLCTSFPDFSYRSDILETGEDFEYPLRNAPPFTDFVAFLWKWSLWHAIRTAKLTTREIYVAIKIASGLPILKSRLG